MKLILKLRLFIKKAFLKIQNYIYQESVRSYIIRDKVIFRDMRRPTQRDKVNLHWFSLLREDTKENLGDYLSVIVCEYMLSLKNLSFDDYVGKTKHLYAVGSVINFGSQNATVWGSGILTDKHTDYFNPKLRKLDIRMVRGPEVRKSLLEKGYNCPEKYGDPAIIMPLIYSPKKFAEKKEYAVVLHMRSKISWEDNLVDIMTTDYKSFIDQLANSKKVITSSLHAIILAEVYRVPAILLHDKVSSNNLFKYNDYYYSTERYEYPVANSIEEAIAMEPVELPTNLEKIRENILESFPYDLWLGK